MRKPKLLIYATILSLIILTLVSVPTYAVEDAVISKHTINLDVNTDGTVSVQESIAVGPDQDLESYTRELPSLVALDLNGDGTKETYDFQYKDITVKDTESNIYTVGNDLNVEIKLKESKQINLEYNIILPKMVKDEESYFFYSPFSLEQDYLFEDLEITINFPKELPNELNAMMYDLNQEPHEDFISYVQAGSTITITNTQKVPTHSLIRVQGNLGANYFEYKKVTDYQLYAVIASVIFIAAVCYYIFFFKMSRSNKSKTLYYPPKDIPVAYFGYILDKEILPQDLFSQVLVWANNGNIDVVQKKHDIFINVVKPLENASSYEEELFHLLFLEGTSVRLQDLENRDMEEDMKGICSRMTLQVFSAIKTPLYINTSKKYHMIYTLLSSVPMALFAAATAFMLTGRGFEVFRYSLITMIIMICSVFPLHFIIKKKDALTKGRMGILNILLVFWIVILWSALIIFLVQAGASKVLLTIIGLLSIAFVFVLLYATKRTKYGKIKNHELTYLRHYMGFVKKPHLSQLTKADNNYFFELLPASYIYGNVHEWFEKFQTIRVEQPDWFYTDVSDKTWMQQMEIVLHDLYFATTNDQDLK